MKLTVKPTTTPARPQSSQGGFTLIELVIVIVILGILAAVAMPRFVDLRSEAAKAATDGMAGALASAFAINYGAYMAAGTAKGIRLSAADQACAAAAASLLQGGYDTAKFSISGTANCSAAGATLACSISGRDVTPNPTATATMICTG